MIIFIFFASSKITCVKVWTESSLLKGIDRYDNRQFLNNKIQYAIRSVQFVKLYPQEDNSPISTRYTNFSNKIWLKKLTVKSPLNPVTQFKLSLKIV